MTQSLLNDSIHQLRTKPSTHELFGDISYSNHNSPSLLLALRTSLLV
jgi:hypothetical protein